MKPHIVKFFQFLEDKEGKNVPLRAKLLNQDKFKITKDDLNVKRSLDLSNSSITSLPDGLRVSGYMFLNGCTSLKTLLYGLYVGKSLYLTNCTSLESLPNGLRVFGDLSLNGCTSLELLPEGLQVGENLYLRKTPLAKMYSEDEIRAMIEATGGYVSRNILI